MSEYKNKKSIVIYFSRADENYNVGYLTKGNTEVIAEYIQELTGAAMFKVERKKPYPKEYYPCIEDAKQEQQNHERPELVRLLPSIDDYEVVYLGSPNYWGGLPQPMYTQLEKLNWQGKIVRPFVTHEGSGLGNIPHELRTLCPGAVIASGLAIQGAAVHAAQNQVAAWL